MTEDLIVDTIKRVKCFRPYGTRKNNQVKDFYTKQGFKKLGGKPKMADGSFRYGLEGKIKPAPEFFKKIESEIYGKEKP